MGTSLVDTFHHGITKTYDSFEGFFFVQQVQTFNSIGAL